MDQQNPVEEMDLAKELKDATEVADEVKNQAVEEDTPDLQQVALTVCGLFITELRGANEKYPVFFRSSAEAQGVLLRSYKDLEQVLRTIRSCDGYAKDQASFDAIADLKREIIQVGAMCIKAAYSLCNLEEDCQNFSRVLQQQTVVAETVQGMNMEVEAEADTAA